MRRGAAEFQSRHSRLDVLINNAGGLFLFRGRSVDGIEMTWALNHLSYFLLTRLLLDLLIASAPSRIVNVASSAHQTGRIDFDNPQRPRRGAAYAQSKLANVMFTHELSRRVSGTNVSANAVHPGKVASRFTI